MKSSHASALVSVLILLLVVHFALQISLGVTDRSAGDLPSHVRLSFIVIPLVGAVFALINAMLLVGWRAGLLLFAVTAVISWTAEELGVRYGFLFGHYDYGDLLGPKLGSVPWVIPAYWFMLVYVSYVIAILISENEPFKRKSRPWSHVLVTSIVAAFTMTAYDLGLDPFMSQKSIGAWTWYENAEKTTRFAGGYFDVPASNFIGWAAVATVIVVACRLLLTRVKSEPVFRRTRLVALLPVVFYAGFWFSHLGASYSVSLRLVSLFSMGVPALAAISRWRHWRDGDSHLPWLSIVGRTGDA